MSLGDVRFIFPLTFPISVTLTALRSMPVSSSRTATLLTPCSLINFMASSTLLFDVAATMEAQRSSDGNEKC